MLALNRVHGKNACARLFQKLTIHTAIVAALTGYGAASAQGSSTVEPSIVSGRILVMPRPGLPDEALGLLLRENGATRHRRFGAGDLRIVDLPVGAERAMVNRLSGHPHLKFAELDRTVNVALATTDPYLGSEWHLHKIGALEAWDTTLGAGITIAILDTGVNSAHPDLVGTMVSGWNVVDNNSNTSDVHGHGTKVAGTAAASANNSIGVAGVAGGAKIMPIRISDATGGATYSAMAAGLTWAADRGARVANISYVAASSAAVLNAAAYLKSKGGLVTTSAGNYGTNANIAASVSMIPVSATTAADGLAGWSSYGSFVAISAPGEGIYTTLADGGYGAVSGTSFSSPITAGVIALMMSARPDLSSSSIEKVLYSSAVDLGVAGRDQYFGYGRVDARAALLSVKAMSAIADTTPPETSIVAPLQSTTVSGIVAINVIASDNVGVSRVELTVNGRLLSTDNMAPFGFSWDSNFVGNGLSTLATVAYDAAGNKASSRSVSVNVANGAASVITDTSPPLVRIFNPVDGSTLAGTVQVRVEATDNLGSAALVQRLVIDGKVVATANGGSLSYSWNTRKSGLGAHQLQAQVRDAAGNTGITTLAVSVSR